MAKVYAILLAALATLSAVAAETSSQPTPDHSAPNRAVLQRADSLVAAGRADAGLALLDSLDAVGRARGDTLLLITTAVVRGGHLTWAGHAGEARPLLRWALPLAVARGDTSLQLKAALWLAYAEVALGRQAAAESLYVRYLPIARADADTLRAGFMELGLAYVQLLDGRTRAALAGYRRAEALLRAAGNTFGEFDAMTGQGRAHEQLGQLDKARATYERVATLARQHDRPQNEADALNNLGNLEFVRGDPAAGLRAFRAGRAVRERLGNPLDVVLPTCNVARALAELGRVTEAEAALDSVAAICRAEGFASRLGHVLNLQAEIRLRQGRAAEALQASRQVLALPADLPVWDRVQALRLASRALAAQDSTEAALALLAGPALALRPRLSPDWALRLDQELAERLFDGGRPREAADLALDAAADALPLRRANDRVALLAVAARGEMACGDTSASLAHVEAAAREWEAARTLPLDLEWRERRASSQRLSETYLLARLALDDSAHAAAAFDGAQRFKARTLAERARLHAAADTAAVVTAERLRREVLREGEVLLDLHVGRDVSHAFLLDGDGCRAMRLPGEAALTARLVLLRDLLAGRAGAAGDPALVTRLAAEAGQELFGELADRLARARRVIVAPDGPFYLVPFDLLLARDGGDLPDVARVPSGDLLARARSRDVAANGAARGLVVAAPRNAAGEVLPGAAHEAAELRRRFRGFTTWRAASDSAAALAGYDVLHFAAHAEPDDQRPWRSGLLIASADGDRPARWLRAEQVAATALQAQLVVLAACASASGQVLAGEGLQGLSSAFIAAGVPTLVATLWPVDDRATARIVRAFYAELAAGATVGDALRAARQDAARRGEAPADWAGFVVVGDPDRRVVLARRRSIPVAAAAGAAIVAAATVLVRRRPRRGAGRKSEAPA